MFPLFALPAGLAFELFMLLPFPVVPPVLPPVFPAGLIVGVGVLAGVVGLDVVVALFVVVVELLVVVSPPQPTPREATASRARRAKVFRIEFSPVTFLGRVLAG